MADGTQGYPTHLSAALSAANRVLGDEIENSQYIGVDSAARIVRAYIDTLHTPTVTDAVNDPNVDEADVRDVLLSVRPSSNGRSEP